MTKNPTVIMHRTKSDVALWESIHYANRVRYDNPYLDIVSFFSHFLGQLNGDAAISLKTYDNAMIILNRADKNYSGKGVI